MASAFVGKCASITAVDLIQQKKLDSRNFYDSNLTEARFDSLPFYSNNYVSSRLCINQEISERAEINNTRFTL